MKKLNLISIVILCLIFSGCSYSSKPVKYYMLSAPVDFSSSQELHRIDNSVIIGLGPVNIPEYLDTSYIVYKITGNRLGMSEYNRWAGLLKKNIQRTLTDSLSKKLSKFKVINWPSVLNINPEFRISIEISRFDGFLNKSVNLKSSICLTDVNNNSRLFLSEISVPVNGKSYDNYAKAMSDALVLLSEKIADTIQNIGEKKIRKEQ